MKRPMLSSVLLLVLGALAIAVLVMLAPHSADARPSPAPPGGGGGPSGIAGQPIAPSTVTLSGTGNKVILDQDGRICFDGVPCTRRLQWDGTNFVFNVAGQVNAPSGFRTAGTVSIGTGAFGISRSDALISTPVSIAGVANGACADSTAITLTNAGIGTICLLAPDDGTLSAGWMASCYVPSPNNIIVRACNHTGGTATFTETVNVRTFTSG